MGHLFIQFNVSEFHTTLKVVVGFDLLKGDNINTLVFNSETSRSEFNLMISHFSVLQDSDFKFLSIFRGSDIRDISSDGIQFRCLHQSVLKVCQFVGIQQTNKVVNDFVFYDEIQNETVVNIVDFQCSFSFFQNIGIYFLVIMSVSEILQCARDIGVTFPNQVIKFKYIIPVVYFLSNGNFLFQNIDFEELGCREGVNVK